MGLVILGESLLENTEQLDFNDEIEGKIKYKLSNFEGPLDLLLHLIRDKKLDIKEIKLAEITGQYLEYMKDLSELELEKQSDFIDIAATLIEIKSKSLLPKVESEEDEVDTEAELIRKLEEYKLLKEASEELKKHENVDRFYKEPEKNANDFKIVLKDFNLEKLIAAFANILHKAEVRALVPTERKVEKDRFTVKEKVFEIKHSLFENSQISFFEMFDDTFSKLEIITTFMAILELLKLQQIVVDQTEQFGDITIKKNEEFFNLELDQVDLSEYNESEESK